MSIIPSGIAPLDQLLGGFSSGRLHLLSGGPGTGKSTACLQFLHAGLRQGEPVALVTHDRTSDLVSHARSVGMELAAPVRAGRLLLVRFGGMFNSLLEGAGSADQMIDDFFRFVTEIRPARLAIDPLTPFLAERSASGRALATLGQMLEEMHLTTLLTFPGDTSVGYDARVEPIVQRAAAIIHLAREDGGVRRMQIVQSRTHATSVALARFEVKPGIGLVPEAAESFPATRKRALRNKATT